MTEGSLERRHRVTDEGLSEGVGQQGKKEWEQQKEERHCCAAKQTTSKRTETSLSKQEGRKPKDHLHRGHPGNAEI
jgi:hypothetical protein